MIVITTKSSTKRKTAISLLRLRMANATCGRSASVGADASHDQSFIAMLVLALHDFIVDRKSKSVHQNAFASTGRPSAMLPRR